jgi:hypothetical protein
MAPDEGFPGTICVNSRNQCIRVGGQDRARQNLFASGILPTIPQAGKSKDRIVSHSEIVGLLFFRSDFLPFVKRICWNKASPRPHRLPERRFAGRCFRHPVNRFKPDGRVFGPERNHPSTHQRKNAEPVYLRPGRQWGLGRSVRCCIEATIRPLLQQRTLRQLPCRDVTNGNVRTYGHHTADKPRVTTLIWGRARSRAFAYRVRSGSAPQI